MNEKTYKKHLTIWIITTIVLVIVSFYVGDKHGQSSLKNSFASRGAAIGMSAGGAARGRFAAGGGAVTGSVIAEDATSMTVKTRDGSSKIVLYSGSTQIAKSTAGAISDVAVGSNVSVIGTQNTDGSVTAQNIQIRPDMPAGTGASTSAPMIPAAAPSAGSAQ